MMSRKEILRALEELVAKLGAKLMYDDINFPGGHCWSKGKLYIVINDRLALDEKIRLLCAGVSLLPWENESLPVEVQHLLIRKK